MQRVAFTALALAALGVSATPATNEPIERRAAGGNIVASAGAEYDFVVIGGGQAGLVMGGRLSDSQYSVLVLEAGSDGSDYADSINIPANAYYGQLWSLPITWDYFIQPQPNLDGYAMEWPRGKVLGGSSAINGMYITHPASVDMDAWAAMVKGMDGADNWNWDSFLAAMQKSENMNAPDAAILQQGNIEYDASVRGKGGPIQMTYPGIAFDVNGDWTTAASSVGLSFTRDAYGGDNFGSFIATSCINPANWTRSYSKSGYLDPLPNRSNYAVLPNAFVNKILFDTSGDNLVANGVEYVVNGETLTVKVKKEVIVSAGSVNTPTVLQHSGVGPADVLTKAGVKVLNDLPGVGMHLMDHLSVQTGWKSNEETAGQMYQSGNYPPALLGYVDDAVAYADSKLLGVSGLESSILANMKSPYTDKTVTAGYEAIVKMTASTLLSSNSGQVEILMGNDLENGTCRIQVCLQHPYSQGSVTIGSNNPQDAPIIDPNYLSHPADLEILIAGLKLARSIGEAAPLSGVLTEYFPGPSVQSDAEWAEFIASNSDTEFHPCATSAMLPLDQGGVVDGNLLVYGTSNVRVADASVSPIEFSAHLMSTTYAIAERASEIILEYWAKGGPNAQTNTVDPKTVKSKPQTDSKGSSSSASSSGASQMLIISPVVTVIAGIILAFTFA